MTQPYYPPQAPDPNAQPGYPPNQPYPPQQQQYPQQGYAYPPQQQAPPPQPLVRGTFAGYYSQPGGGKGKSINSFLHKQLGQSFTGTVRWTITPNDLEQQTDMVTKQPKFFRNDPSQPMMKLVLPLLTQASVEFPDGQAVWHVLGADRDELNRAMEAAGVPLTDVGDGVQGRVPEAGAQITIRFTHQRPVPNMNAQNVHEVTYRRPGANGQAPAPAPQAAPVPAPAANVVAPQQWQQPAPPAPAPAPVQYQAPAPAPAPASAPAPPMTNVAGTVQYATDQATAAAQAAMSPQQAPAPAPVQQQGPQALAAPAGMDDAGAANLAKVSGQPIRRGDGAVVFPDGQVQLPA